MARNRSRATRTAPSWSWQDEAACQAHPVRLFFGVDGERPAEREARERRAKAVCEGCPVQGVCREHALTQPENFGVWGGMNEDERTSERRRRSRRRVA